FTFTEDGATDIFATARHKNRAYTWAVTGGPSVTAPAVVNTQDPSGPSRLAFGFKARGSGARECAEIGATTELSDLIGVLHRNEARALRQIPDVDDAVAACTVSLNREYDSLPIPYEGTAPEPGAAVYLRRAQTSSSGTVGALLAAPAGSAQVSTYTPVADALAYGFEYGYNGQHYVVH